MTEMPSHSKLDPHREKFVKEIRALLLKAGFDKSEVAMQGPTEKGPDIIVKAKDQKTILVQCRWSRKPGKEYRGLDRLISEYRTLMQDYKADASLLALKEYVIPPSFKEKEKIDKFRQEDRVVYWDDDILKYYKRMIGTIGKPHSKYILLKDLGFKIPIQKQPYKVKAIKVRQRDCDLFLFSIEPEKLLKLAYVSRRDMRDPSAYQRLLSSERLGNIGKFVSQDVHGESGLLANNIILAFEEKGVEFSGRTLKIPAVYCSAWVVDGQHRLYGFCKLDKKLPREEREETFKSFPLICVGIRDVRQSRQAMLFREINEFQKRINRNLLLDLFHHLEIDKELCLRVDIVKHLRDRPIFKDRIKILGTDKGIISLANFIDYPRMKEFVTKHHRKAYGILTKYFETVRDVFPKEYWEAPKQYVLWTNKGIRMLLTLLDPIIEYGGANEKNFRKCLTALKDSTSEEEDYFKTERYRGKALGAGAPDIVALEQWAKKIQERIIDFPVESEMNPEAYPILQKLETALRTCIETELSKIPKDWWKHRIPGDVKGEAESRKAKNERPWPWILKADLHPIHFVNFSDYRKIITRSDNWRDVFEKIFKDKELTSSYLKELEQIRNSTMHPRKLSRLELCTLELNAEKLSTAIRSATAGEITEEVRVPQANDLDLVAQTAIAVITNKIRSAPSFASGRQKHYYRTAAEILGLIHRIKDEYRPTNLGKKYVDASSEEREKILSNAVLEVPIFKSFLEYSREQNKRTWNLDDIGEFVQKQAGLSKTTARRRAQVMTAWLLRVGHATKKGAATIAL